MSEHTKTSSAYTPNMDTPTGHKRRNRALAGFLLTILLPPIGLVVLWRNGIFRTRGRLVLTVIATVEMTLLFTLIIPEKTLISDVPVPVASVAVTAAPDDEAVSVLANISQVLAAKQAEETGVDVVYEDADEEAAAIAAQQEAIWNTTVYSVYSGAKYYHTGTVCGTQSNRRSLTVREAVAEGMGACPNCDPPVPTL